MGCTFERRDAAWCAAAGVKLMVSVDGVGESHDRLRVRRGGGGSFAGVEHTVDHVLLPQGIRPDITTTISGANAQAAASVAQWAVVERGLPLNFNLYRTPLVGATRHDLQLEEQTIVQGLRDAFAVIERNMPDTAFLGGMLDRLNMQAHTHTCGVGQSYIVVGHTGEVSACQMHMGGGQGLDDHTDLLPLVASGPIPVIPLAAKSQCSTCAIRHRCAGGLPHRDVSCHGTLGRAEPQLRHLSQPGAGPRASLRALFVTEQPPASVAGNAELGHLIVSCWSFDSRTTGGRQGFSLVCPLFCVALSARRTAHVCCGARLTG